MRAMVDVVKLWRPVENERRGACTPREISLQPHSTSSQRKWRTSPSWDSKPSHSCGCSGRRCASCLFLAFQSFTIHLLSASASQCFPLAGASHLVGVQQKTQSCRTPGLSFSLRKRTVAMTGRRKEGVSLLIEMRCKDSHIFTNFQTFLWKSEIFPKYFR